MPAASLPPILLYTTSESIALACSLVPPNTTTILDIYALPVNLPVPNASTAPTVLNAPIPPISLVSHAYQSAQEHTTAIVPMSAPPANYLASTAQVLLHALHAQSISTPILPA